MLSTAQYAVKEAEKFSLKDKESWNKIVIRYNRGTIKKLDGVVYSILKE